MLKRAAAINADPALLYRVTRIEAFGSYITDAPVLGDIDVALTLEYRHEHGDIVTANRQRFLLSGRQSGSYIDRLHFGYAEVWRLLKARNPYLSLHTHNHVEQLGCACRDLFVAPAASS
jgi:hypothetical protein